MYGQLPSYVQAHATTYDVMVMDVMLSWEQQKENERTGKTSTPKLSQKEMMDMIKRARGE